MDSRRGNRFICGRSLLKGTKVIFHGRNCSVTIGDGNRLTGCKFEFFGDDNHVVIGDNNTFKETSFWLEDSGSVIQIGHDNRLCGCTHLGIAEGARLTIADNCLFSKNIYITTTDSHSIIDSTGGERINRPADVSIGSHVWLGRDVTIGKGVAIATDVVVGGKSYVTRPVDETNVVVAGIPAKVVRRGIIWKSERI